MSSWVDPAAIHYSVLSIKTFSMKKSVLLFMFFICASTIVYSQETAPSQRVNKVFSAKFKNATEVKWISTEEGYTVIFNVDSTRYNVRYNEEAIMVQTTRYYGSCCLPEKIASKVKLKYPDMKVVHVTEITDRYGSILYGIRLEDDVYSMVVEVTDHGRVKEMRKFRREV
jgi:hypothetical protein